MSRNHAPGAMPHDGEWPETPFLAIYAATAAAVSGRTGRPGPDLEPGEVTIPQPRKPLEPDEAPDSPGGPGPW